MRRYSGLKTGCVFVVLMAWLSFVFAEEVKTSGLVIQDAWIQEASPAAKVHVAYMRLANTGNAMIEITGVMAEHYDMAMIHQTVVRDGMAMMNHLDALAIAPHSSVVLEPGGTHIMLMKPAHPQKRDEKVLMTFQLKEGLQQRVEVSVRAAP